MKTFMQELVSKLNKLSQEEFKIIVMPHLCLDHFVHFGEDHDSLLNSLKDIANRGGGNIAVSQTLTVGGKAANCALGLSSLGLHPQLITKTSESGFQITKHFFGERQVDLSHIKKNGKLALTTTIELKGSNIMLSDPGSLSQFGPEILTESDIKLITEADLVCISDWGLNEKATALAKYVYGLVKDKGKGKTFFDPGDPSPKQGSVKIEIERMKSEVLEEGLVDILSVNEDEVKKYGGIEYLRKFARVDLHTNEYAVSYYKDYETEKTPVFNVEPIRLTGAGDAWNAGDILGNLHGFSDELRLLMANATAAYYISDLKGRHPASEDIIKFLEAR